MPFTYGDFTFNFSNQVISASSTATIVEVQNLINAVRYAEESSEGIQYPKIANAAGKDSLGSGISVGITLDLLPNWQLKFADRSGPSYVQCFVQEGNLVGGLSGNPIKSSAFTQVFVIRSAASTLVSSSAVSANISDSDKIDISNKVWINSSTSNITNSVWTNSGTSVLNNITITGVTASTDNIAIANQVWTNSKTGAFVYSIWGVPASSFNQYLTADNKSIGSAINTTFTFATGNWKMEDNQLKIYQGSNLLFVFNLFDKNGNPSLTGIRQRTFSSYG
jgi:hypothetical protein